MMPIKRAFHHQSNSNQHHETKLNNSVNTASTSSDSNSASRSSSHSSSDNHANNGKNDVVISIRKQRDEEQPSVSFGHAPTTLFGQSLRIDTLAAPSENGGGAVPVTECHPHTARRNRTSSHKMSRLHPKTRRDSKQEQSEQQLPPPSQTQEAFQPRQQQQRQQRSQSRIAARLVTEPHPTQVLVLLPVQTRSPPSLLFAPHSFKPHQPYFHNAKVSNDNNDNNHDSSISSTRPQLPTIMERQVHFNSEVEVRMYPPRTAEETRAAWLQPEDIRRIREDCRTDIQKSRQDEQQQQQQQQQSSDMPNQPQHVEPQWQDEQYQHPHHVQAYCDEDEDDDDDDDDDDDSFCFRGLEWNCADTATRREKDESRLASLEAVLSEQDDQRAKGFCDANIIAFHYVRSGMEARRAAYLQGLQDAVCVLDDDSSCIWGDLDQHCQSRLPRRFSETDCALTTQQPNQADDDDDSTRQSVPPKPCSDRAIAKPQRRGSMAQKVVAKAA